MLKKWYFWVILGLVVVAGLGVLYGVLTHRESGFMGVCWTDDGQVFKYHDPVTNKNPECTKLLMWKKTQFPLFYYVAFENVYSDSVVKAANLWNREIGRELFRQVEKEDEAAIRVVWGSVRPGRHVGGYTTHYGGPDIPLEAKVTLTNPSDLHALYRFAAHEWGHVLGLAHDESPRSIMYPVQPDVTSDLTFVLPSDADKKLLKKAYGKKEI